MAHPEPFARPLEDAWRPVLEAVLRRMGAPGLEDVGKLAPRLAEEKQRWEAELLRRKVEQERQVSQALALTIRERERAEEALRRASLDWSSLDEVLLTGGSSLLWPLQQRMRERCPRVRIHDDPGHPLNPLTIVASGAAIHGAALAEGGARVGG